jgi:hypothetical protein
MGTEAGMSGAGGPPPGPPPAGGQPPSGSNDAASGTAPTQVAGTDASSATDLLATFIKQLQSSQGQGSGYGATGTSGGRASGALVVNFEA